ncbi:MAG: N-formylglutamate amidohydrolase [Sphingomonadales bacterium]
MVNVEKQRTAMNDGDWPPAYEIDMPAEQTVPFVFSSPHSGSYYPPSFIAQSRLGPLTLRGSEDSFVDYIFAAAPKLGAPLIKAVFARAYLDVNREPFELDPAMFDTPLPDHINTTSPRVREGLGTIARTVASGTEIYPGKLSIADAEARINNIHRPYHRCLADLLAKTFRQFGCSVLVDCHSMPSGSRLSGPSGSSLSGSGARSGTADIVIGDRFATSCNGALVDAAQDILADMGYSVARNAPYAGGFITSHYGAPEKRVHALQIEIKRSLYMDEERIEPNDNLKRLRNDFTCLIRELAALDPCRPGPQHRAYF